MAASPTTTDWPERVGVRLLVAAFLLLAASVPARADATFFVGAVRSEATRTVIGAAIGLFPRATASVLGFEVEFARTPGDARPNGGRIQTTGGSLIVQSFPLARRWQVYGLFGGGVYGETVDGRDELGMGGAAHIGGGVKFALVGVLRARLDYRVYIPGNNEDSGLRINRHPTRLAA